MEAHDYFIVEARSYCYYLFFLVKKDCTLKDLDKALRAYWLECCGHLSQFKHGKNCYWNDVQPQDNIQEMNQVPFNLFHIGDNLKHEYDFGTPTETRVIIVAEISSTIGKDVVLLAKKPPVILCTANNFTCSNPAVFTNHCGENFCKEHSQDQDEEELLPVCNSPRFGECGYYGHDEEDEDEAGDEEVEIEAEEEHEEVGGKEEVE